MKRCWNAEASTFYLPSLSSSVHTYYCADLGLAHKGFLENHASASWSVLFPMLIPTACALSGSAVFIIEELLRFDCHVDDVGGVGKEFAF